MKTRSLFNEVLIGAIGGISATAPMTMAMLAMHRRLPRQQRYALPPRQIVERLIDKTGMNRQLDEPERVALSQASHFAYGSAAGAIYAPIAKAMSAPPLAGGILFGLLVWTSSYLGLLPALGLLSPATRHPAKRNVLMIVAHVVWGAALGFAVEQLQENKSGTGLSHGKRMPQSTVVSGPETLLTR